MQCLLDGFRESITFDFSEVLVFMLRCHHACLLPSVVVSLRLGFCGFRVVAVFFRL